ncbi:MAG: hypothetical protein V3T85_00085 [Acidiferrobacterales bacterium]
MECILCGLQNPATLPDAEMKTDSCFAAPSLANRVDAASKGNVEALQILADRGTQGEKPVLGILEKLGKFDTR